MRSILHGGERGCKLQEVALAVASAARADRPPVQFTNRPTLFRSSFAGHNRLSASLLSSPHRQTAPFILDFLSVTLLLGKACSKTCSPPPRKILHTPLSLSFSSSQRVPLRICSPPHLSRLHEFISPMLLTTVQPQNHAGSRPQNGRSILAQLTVDFPPLPHRSTVVGHPSAPTATWVQPSHHPSHHISGRRFSVMCIQHIRDSCNRCYTPQQQGLNHSYPFAQTAAAPTERTSTTGEARVL